MSNLKRLFLILICIVMIAGCMPAGSKQKSERIVIWHWIIDRKDTFDALAKMYKDQTGIEVEFKLFFPPDIYRQKVITVARAQKLPDIFGILGEKKILASFIKAGHVLNLNSYMDADDASWRNRFYPQTLGLVTFNEANNYGVDEGVYGVPIDTTLMQFIYNKALFKKAGLNPSEAPETFDQFLDYAKKIKKAVGVEGFVCGWRERWLLNSVATEWAINIMGEDKFIKTIKGEVPYTDEDWIRVFSLFATLRESGILSSNIGTMTNKESEDAFSKGKAVFSFNGSWAVNVYKQLNPDLDYAFFSLPKASDKFPVKIWGGAGSSFMVNAKSPNKDKAVAFLNWLSDVEQQEFLARETNNLPSIKGCESIPEVLRPLLKDMDSLTHPNIWPYNEDYRVTEVFNRGLQQIVMGISTPEEVAREVQNSKERISRK